MEPFVRRFIKASLAWLAIGGLLGVDMAFRTEAIAYRAAHAHALLFGFVGMLIFGVSYHVMPRFTGRPLHSRALAVWHLRLANAGLALMTAAWLLRPAGMGAWDRVLQAGAVTTAVAGGLFIVNLWKTLPGARG